MQLPRARVTNGRHSYADAGVLTMFVDSKYLFSLFFVQ